MTIVFYSCFMNHHQIGISDELYILTEGNYFFVESQQISEEMIKSGYPVYERDYILRPYQNQQDADYSKRLAITADVAIFGGNEELSKYRFPRLKNKKLTLEYSERWLKKGLINLLSPRLIYFFITYHLFYRRNHNYYALCSSAYASADYNFLGAFRNKCFKWGYFTEVNEWNIKEKFNKSLTDNIKIRFMWCARFIDWKHPEIPIMLAKHLKNKGYSFTIDMFGSGKIILDIKNKAKELKVEDVVSFKGNVPNTVIINEMKLHDIFLFTSDQNEGWGAVANEALSAGCLLIANKNIGAVPYLVEDNVSGLTYDNLNSLFDKVDKVMDNKQLIKEIAINGYNEILKNWTPFKAAENLYKLSEELLVSTNVNIIEQGPCSIA